MGVEEPSIIHVWCCDCRGGNRKVERFVEKPVDDKIYMGSYLLDPSVFDRIQLKPTWASQAGKEEQSVR
ncbi:unnamed protein product [Urochloa humidicola]